MYQKKHYSLNCLISFKRIILCEDFGPSNEENHFNNNVKCTERVPYVLCQLILQEESWLVHLSFLSVSREEVHFKYFGQT